MTSRALIVAPPIAPSVSIKEAFERLGWESTLFTTSDGVASGLAHRVVARASRAYRESLLVQPFNQLLKREVIPLALTSRPCLILFVKCRRITDENAESLARLGVPLALWTTDSLCRAPGQEAVASIAFHKFYMDGGDARDSTSTWLPLGYDDRRACVSGVKDFDILFLGYLKQPQYATRLRLLHELANSDLATQYKCGFVGSTGSRWGDGRLRWSLSVRPLGYASPADYASYISRSKVCVNVHQDDGLRPVNPSFFSIPGSGVCQVTDSRSYLADWLTPEREFATFAVGHYLETLARLMRDSALRESIAAEGLRAVRGHHTFVHRVGTILEVLGLRPRRGISDLAAIATDGRCD